MNDAAGAPSTTDAGGHSPTEAPAAPQESTGRKRRAGLPVVALFTLATFVGAGLVFLIQPMVAKMLLPLLGGSPMVWNTSMVFFQALLLAGYWYAHSTIRDWGLRRQPLAHLVVLLLPLLVLPIALPAGWSPPPDTSPTTWLLMVLLVVVGGPYFVVTTASPLLQRWFAATTHRQAHDPYFLYAAGNVGSMLGLLAYPLLIEPRLTLAAQARLWAAGYVVFMVLTAACVVALAIYRGDHTPAAPAADAHAQPAPTTTWLTRARWVTFAFLPSSLMLGVTQFLSTDIASVPLLWVLPLSLYLMTFILAFARISDQVVTLSSRVLPFLALGVAITLLGALYLPTWAIFAIHLLTLLAVGLLGHGRLAQERPAPSRLTEFYLLLSLGGVLGGMFNALVAPLLFDSVLEYPLVIVAALLLRRSHRRPGLLPQRWRWVEDVVLLVVLYRLVVDNIIDYQWMEGIVGDVGFVLALLLAIAAVWLLSAQPAVFTLAMAAIVASGVLNTGPLLAAERTFFGVYQVYAEDDRHVLMHGTTIHGFQDTAADRTHLPLSYHHPDGPIGQLYDALEGDPRLDDVAVLGLGVGTMAAYGEAGQDYTFYEIDPAVLDIATDPELFTYLSDSEAEVDVVLGDGRLTLADSDDRYGLIFLNAFTSDAIPTHLLTREAVQTYLEHLQPGGILVFNVTNRYLGIEPVVAAIGADLGLAAIASHDDEWDGEEGRFSSQWVLLAEEPRDFGPLLDDDRWYVPSVPPGTPVWTDDFSNVFSVYRWD